RLRLFAYATPPPPPPESQNRAGAPPCRASIGLSARGALCYARPALWSHCWGESTGTVPSLAGGQGRPVQPEDSMNKVLSIAILGISAAALGACAQAQQPAQQAQQPGGATAQVPVVSDVLQNSPASRQGQPGVRAPPGPCTAPRAGQYTIRTSQIARDGSLQVQYNGRDSSYRTNPYVYMFQTNATLLNRDGTVRDNAGFGLWQGQ